MTSSSHNSASPSAFAASHRNALLVLIGGACVIGLSPICVRLAEAAGGGQPGAGPAAVGFWRLVFALPLMTLLGLAESRRTASATFRRPSPILLVAALFFVADLIFWHYGLRYTSVVDATVLSNLTPVLVTIVAWLALKETPRPAFLLGMALAVAGAIWMAVSKGGAGGGPGAGKASYVGDGLSALTAVWYGGYFLAVREARRTLSTSAVMIWTSLIGAPVLLAVAWVLHEPLLAPTALGWGALVLLGLVHVTGQGAVAWALGRLPTALTAVVVLVQPVVAATLGWIIFGEAITPIQAVAGMLALAGVALAQLAARPIQPLEAPVA
jgi:drug/metabolite transporter (DMT)-like permease